MQRDSAIFYRSFYEAIKDLGPVQQANVYNAIFELSFNNTEVSLDGIEKTIFTLIKPQIEANLKRFQNGSKAKRKQNGSKTEANLFQSESKMEANNNNNNNNNLNNNNNDDLILPFTSSEYIETWKMLLAEKKWKKKSINALKMANNLLAKQTESDAIQMMRNAIAGNWQGLFELDKKQNGREKQTTGTAISQFVG